ncbi:MAG TPA: FmdB family zinc ribbon protein [Actinomycetota bacterium]|jgi:putative FmdB family regulatory protein
MPTYEYECTACGRHIEVFQRISENPLSECGACGGKLRKVFHPAGIVFKGSGFYATDSRSGAKTKAGESADKGSSDKGSGEKTSSKDSKSTDASSSTSSKDSSSGGGSTSKAAASKESS